MVANPVNLRAVAESGYAALKRGDATTAREHLNRVIAGGGSDAAVWFGLSYAHRLLGADAEEEAALDQALKLDAQHLPALLAKGDLFAKRGDRRAAGSYYNAAINLAGLIESLPSEWRAEIERAKAAAQRFAAEYEGHLVPSLLEKGLGAPGSFRFAHAIDLLLNKRQIYQQQPKYFYFPELPQIQFYDRLDHPWAAPLERQWSAIRDEAAQVMQSGAGIVPYVQRAANRPTFNPRGLLDNPDWGAFFLIKDGVTVAENAAHCPRTMAAINDLPLCRIDNRTPSVLFSMLSPGARIPPHHGFTNARLICHLPLIVPPNCALRVGNETRAWREGELVLFDDSIEHEAWNGSDEPRAVLLFDIWRPELSELERSLVRAMLESIDEFDGARRRWTD